MKFRYTGVHVTELVVMLSLIAVTLTILFNVAFVHSSIIGVGASSIYIVFTGFLLGRTFLGDEHEFFSSFLFGIFLVLSFFILMGTPIIVFYELNVPSLAFVLFVPLMMLAVQLKFKRLNLAKSGSVAKKVDDVPYFSLVYIFPFVLMVYAGFLIISARSGWIYGTIWDVVSPSFFPAYFLAAVSLFGVILYSKTKTTSKILLTTMFSLLSITISALILYPGDMGDRLGQMGESQLLLNYGSLRTPLGLSLGPWNIYWLLKRKGLTLLTAMVAKMFVVDLYWIHTFITAVSWGVFVPLVAYKIVRAVGGKERVSVLAAFLTTFFSLFIVWGSISTGNSFGYLLFFVSLYFSMRYLKSEGNWLALPLATLAATVSGLAHPFTGEMAFTFLFLAFCLKRYRTIKVKSPRRAYIFMIISFIGCLLVIQATFALQNILYLNFASPAVRENYIREGIIAFSPETLFKTDLWFLVFGEYVDFSFKEVFLLAAMPILGFVGLVYTLSKKDGYEGVLVLFIFLAFVICVIDYRVMRYGMVNVPFGPGRIWVMRDLIAVPFMAVTVNSFVRFLEGGTLRGTMSNPSFKGLARKFSWRRVVALMLVGISLAAFATSSTYRSYSLINTLHPTQLEVEAVKYIDAHTDGRYVVLSTTPWMSIIGHAFVGWYNPKKYYVYGAFLYPSVAEMMKYISQYKATVGYFIAPSFRTPDFDEVIAGASRNFGLFKVLSNENGEVYILNYKIPPLPQGYPNTDADVMAFYWSTPPSYIIQNGYGRLVFNLQGNDLAVTDFWGDLYESIDLSETLVGGKGVGSLISVEYFESSNETWNPWSPSENVFQAQQFQFRLNFEYDSLIGVVEKGKPFVELSWEGAGEYSFSVLSGDFQRLYIPGLVGGETPYDLRRHQFGLLYTLSRTNDVMLAPPGYGPESEYSSSLDFTQIQRDCRLVITSKYLSYDFSVRNDAAYDQWAQIEVWIPDKIYIGITASIVSSVDGGLNWTSGGPLETLGGVDVNWAVSLPGNSTQNPVVWKYVRSGIGGYVELPRNFTDSSGGQSRLLLGIYLPAGDEALVRLSFTVYYLRPLKITYVFRDLEDMEEGLIKYYDYGTSAYVGGLTSTLKPSALAIVVDESGKIASIQTTIPSGTTFSLDFAKGDTTVDVDADGVPDFIEG